VKHTQHILLQILAAKAGIHASFSRRDTFATDGKRVYVPEWAQTLPTDVLLGFFAHEAVGHIRMTDFEVKSEMPLANSVLNLLEDIRIERMIPLIFPGARRLLAETAEYASRRFWLPPDPGEEADALNQGFFWLVRRLRRDILGQLADVPSKKHLARIEAAIPKEWLDKCHEALEIAREALSTADKTADLLPASETIARLFANSAPGTQGDQGDQGDRDTQGHQGNGRASGSPDSQGDQGGPSQGDREGGRGEESGGAHGSRGVQKDRANADQGDHGDDGSCRGQGGREDREDRGDSGQGRQEDLLQRQVSLDLGSLLFAEASGNANASWGVSRLQPERTPPHVLLDRTSPEEREAAIRIAAKMRGGLQDALRRVLEDEDDRHTTAGRFDPRMAASAYKGLARDVFLEEGEEAPGLDARILLLIDASGSMHTLQSGVRGMLCGIVQALGVIPEVDLGIAFYDSRITYITPLGASGHTLAQVAKSYLACGFTNWREAASEALPWFFGAKRPRQKNILFTLTDGDVNMDGHIKVLLQRLGVECRFLIIGIGDGRYPNQIGDDYPVVRLPQGADATQVARGCLDLLKDGILRRA